ncbi:MAG: hypothetical protein Q4G27_02955 [Flavobacteriaceae bacterium]|nr:hypothetical protein [Flavobacteriaceae bacterium]
MKKIVLLLAFLLIFTSCEVTEKVYINPDNSAKYSFALNVSQIRMMALNPNHMDENFPTDTIMTIQEFAETDILGLENHQANSEEDKILEEVFDDFKVHVKITEKEGLISFFTEKKNISELNNTMSLFQQKLSASRKKKEQEESKDEELLFSELMGNLELNFDGKNFSRKGKMNFNSVRKEGGFNEGDFRDLASIMSYTLEYHFPRPVKTISDTSVLMSWDRKTIYLRKPFLELISNPKAYDFTLELED